MRPRFSFTMIFWRHLLTALVVIIPAWCAANAAELDGVRIPDTVYVGGKRLQLNGYGLRTYSVFRVHIYIASLYVEHLSSNPEEIIRSPETKLLNVTFERNVDADDAKKAWREGLTNNCQAPCSLDPRDVERFIAQVPAMHASDNFSLLFTKESATIMTNGRPIGVIPQQQFAQAVLATFLGPNPASPALKQELLRGHG
jgi:hypothetical protein